MPYNRSQNPESGIQKFWVLGLAGWLAATVVFCPKGLAVTSKVHRQANASEFSKGDPNEVVVGSRGTLQLAQASRIMADHLEGAWSVSSLVVVGSTVYAGTSPNGAIYEYSRGQLKKVYPVEEERKGEAGDSNTPPDANRVPHEHVFAMTTDLAGRLLAGISGSPCRLIRLTSHGAETLCEFSDAKYIFALALDEAGMLFIATGPEGKVYQWTGTAKTPTLVYDSPDKNILSLAVAKDGSVYAGTDGRGLIYRIRPKDRTATVVYDCAQPEIAGLTFADSPTGDGQELYAIGTSAKVVPPEREVRVTQVLPGRPEPARRGGDGPSTDSGGDDGRVLKVANTKKETPAEGPPARPVPSRRSERADSASRLYHISRAGYVTEAANESAVFFCLGHSGKVLLIGAGNDARVLRVDPVLEQQSVVYQDKQAAQVTALVTLPDGELVLGTANPAKIIGLAAAYAPKGVYTSDLIDADQPARWGKLQIEADVPSGSKVLVSSRSGNVEDVNDSTFSAWSEPVEATGPVPLTCPLGRFCQYRLILQTERNDATPVVHEVTVATTIPNLAPTVEAVDVTRLENPPSKQGFYKVNFKTRDANDDKLVYTLYFRQVGHGNWIRLKENLEDESFEWDGRTVEDGRYEIRVVASDERSNTPSTKLTGSRISDPVVVDNTGPTLRVTQVERKGRTVTVTLSVTDALSAISQLEYTVDSNAEWKGTVPEDGVYDTTDESFVIQLDDLAPGEHVLALKASDDLDNTTYKTVDVSLAGRP
jgi:hypothetical protein